MNGFAPSARTWTATVLLFLGIWLILIPLNLGAVALEIHLSNFITGVVVLVLAGLSFRWTWPRWLLALTGVWLQLAPLLFWLRSPALYINDVLVGILLIVFAVIIPRPVGDERGLGSRPPGWSYNPSAWAQRLPVVVLASLCYFITQHLAAFQLGYIVTVWDPAFGEGTMRVLSSKVSAEFPISDAGLGSVAYLIEALMACLGDPNRWRSGPWLVLFFGFLVIPVGLVSIFLIMLQPLAVGAWCGWCLLTALCMLGMIVLTVDEVWAALQFLHRHAAPGSRWSIFWLGGTLETAVAEQEKGGRFRYAFRGARFHWNLALSALLGIWLMVTPAALGVAENQYVYFILGPLIVCASIISMAEVVKWLRFVNLVFACLLLAAIALFPRTPSYLINHIVVGVLVILLNAYVGANYEQYGRRSVVKM
jgi:uncharacterized membrane protein